MVFPQTGRGSEVQRVGAVVAHCVSCGGGAGVFMRVRDCELLLLAAPARGAKLPAPYLDSYGETDQVGSLIIWWRNAGCCSRD